jgi:hypothetical protein
MEPNPSGPPHRTPQDCDCCRPAGQIIEGWEGFLAWLGRHDDEERTLPTNSAHPGYDRSGLPYAPPAEPAINPDDYPIDTEQAEVDGFGRVIGGPEERAAFRAWLSEARRTGCY